jgi:hypothetical protein
MTHSAQPVLTESRLHAAMLAMATIVCSSVPAVGQAQVRNARALYDQAVDEVQAGTAPRIDLTRTEVQLHTEEYNLSVSRNNFAVAKLDLTRAIGLPLGQQFELADQLPYSDLNPPSLYAEVYWLLAAVSALMFVRPFLLAKNEPGAGGEVQMH